MRSVCPWLKAAMQGRSLCCKLEGRTLLCAGWLGKKAYKGVYTYAKPLN